MSCVHTRVPAEGSGHVATKRRDNRSRAFPSSLPQLAPFPFSPRQPRQLSSPPICQVEPSEQHPVEPKRVSPPTFPPKNETLLPRQPSSSRCLLELVSRKPRVATISLSLSSKTKRSAAIAKEAAPPEGRKAVRVGLARSLCENEIEPKILEQNSLSLCPCSPRDRIDIVTDDNRNLRGIFARERIPLCPFPRAREGGGGRRSERRRKAERRFHETTIGTPVFHPPYLACTIVARRCPRGNSSARSNDVRHARSIHSVARSSWSLYCYGRRSTGFARLAKTVAAGQTRGRCRYV